ncbi:MAG TPA: hypothetical protein VJ914_23440 [Pseudonocardiaceae bacterium]|nr:hypothetical protein [Pseudonocardiaceae bacterium]
MKQRGISPWTPETTSPQPKLTRPPRQQRPNGTALAVLVGAIVFAAVVAVVVVIGPRHYQTMAGTPISDITKLDNPTSLNPVVTTTTEPTTTSEPTPPQTSPTAPQAQAGYQPESGPGGIQVNIPAGWNVRSPFASEDEADAPDGSGSLIRYGGTPSASMSLLDAVSSDEAGNTSVKTGYQQLQLNNVSSPSGDDTVVWEFLFDKNGVQRHVLSWFWRANGYDYVLYFSSTAANWPAMQAAVTVGEQTAGPT